MKCPACEADALEYRYDRDTGKPVKEAGKFLMRCAACGDVRVLRQYELDRLAGKPPRKSRLAWAAGILGATTTAIYLWLVYGFKADREDSVALPYLLLSFPAIGCLAYAFRSFSDARTVTSPRDRVNLFAVGIFFLLAAIATAWMGVALVRRGKL